MAKKKKKKVSKKVTRNKKTRNKKTKSVKKNTKTTASKNKTVESKKSTKNISSKKGKDVTEKKEPSKKNETQKSVKKNTKIKQVKKEVTNKSNNKKTVEKNVIVEENKNEENDVVVNQKSTKKSRKRTIKKILRRLFIILFLVGCILLIVLFVKTMANKGRKQNTEFEKININEYLDLYDSGELNFIYLSNDNCLDCNNYEINLGALQSEYKISIKELNYTDLDEEELQKLQMSNSALNEKIGIPTILSIKDGKEIDFVSGVKEYSVLKKFVSNSLNPTNTNSFEKISLDKYLSLLKEKNTTFIYIGNSNNNGCKKFTPVLESVSSKRKLKVYYLDTNNFSKEEEWDKLENSANIFKNTWFMPTIIVVKNGKIKDYKMETLDNSSLEKFLKKNGL